MCKLEAYGPPCTGWCNTFHYAAIVYHLSADLRAISPSSCRFHGDLDVEEAYLSFLLHSAINRQGVSRSAPYEVSHSFEELAGQAGDFERFSQLVSFARLALKHVKFGRGSGRRKDLGRERQPGSVCFSRQKPHYWWCYLSSEPCCSPTGGCECPFRAPRSMMAG